MSEEKTNEEGYIKDTYVKDMKEQSVLLKAVLDQLGTKSKEIEHVKQQLENTADALDAKFIGNITKLTQEIENLKAENFLIRNLPSKLGEKLEQLIPSISANLQKRIFEDLESTMKLYNERLTELAKKSKQITSEATTLSRRELGRKALGFGATIFFASILTIGVTYFAMQKFPQFINIDTTGNINIERSNLSIWEKEKRPAKNN